MQSRYERKVDELVSAALHGPGHLEPAMRAAAFNGDDVAPDVSTYVDKLRRHAYKVTDGDVAALLASGWSDDQVFELTVATALGEGMRRLRVGLDLVAEG